MLVAQSCLTFSDLLYPWNSAGKDTGVCSHSLFQGNFPTQGSNLGLLHGRRFLYHLSECSRENHNERTKYFQLKNVVCFMDLHDAFGHGNDEINFSQG